MSKPPNMALQLTRCYAELGNWTTAKATVDEALRKNPGHARLIEVRNRLRNMPSP